MDWQPTEDQAWKANPMVLPASGNRTSDRAVVRSGGGPMSKVHNGALSATISRKRRHPYPLRIKALLHAGGERRLIEITNYSRQGLSLKGAAGIELGERVTVELLSGQRLPVMAVWVQDGRANARFLGPLASGHTVMRWLREAARRYASSRSA
jgi:hypothetical protein